MPDSPAIGRPTPLIEGRAKVTGTTRYVADLNWPGLLHARLVTSLYAHANLRRIDTQAARAVPGVVAVLTAADLPDIEPSSRGRLLLARGRVIFAGQPVAMVIATSEAIAEDAVQLVVVDYEPLPAAASLDAALAEGAPLVWPQGVPGRSGEAGDEESETGTHGAEAGGAETGSGAQGNTVARKAYTRGDVQAGLAQADVVVERTFTTPTVHQSPIETQSVLVQPDPATGGATLWASTQGPFAVRRSVARVLGVPESVIRVHGAPVGGGFGSKNGLYEPLVALAARAVGQPLRLVLTRSEELLASVPAPATRIRARLGGRRDGSLTGLQATVECDNGCFPFELADFIGLMLASFYRLPHFRVDTADVLTFKPSAGAYRAPGATSTLFALDSLMDELAHKLGLDPLEFRLQNAVVAGDLMADGKPWPSIGMHAVLEALREHPAWQGRQQARAAGRGVGIAVGGWMGGTEPAAALCSLDRDGTLQLNLGSADITGTATGFALMAAETFGVAPDTVRVIISDTDTAPYSGSSAGSKVTYSTGGAVLEAARSARQQVLAVASDELEAAVEDLEIVAGRVQVRGAPDRGIPLPDLAAKTLEWSSRYAPVMGAGRFAQEDSAPAFSAQLAEVEVDAETGEVRVHRLVVVQDVGRAINPLAIQGQMMGGATQGLGWALYEAMLYDEHGQALSGTWMDYTVPGQAEAARRIETVIVEVPSDHGPLGVRGVGEAPVVPTPAAVANAIADRTGVRLTDLPMTAPRVWAALHKQPGGKP